MQFSPLKSLCGAALTCSDAARSWQSQHCHTMSGRSALIAWGLAVTPFRDGTWGLKLNALARHSLIRVVTSYL